MPKTILLPEQLVTDKTKWPKVVVLEEHEFRKLNGDLLFGTYYFLFNSKTYFITYFYKNHKPIKSYLSCIN